MELGPVMEGYPGSIFSTVLHELLPASRTEGLLGLLSAEGNRCLDSEEPDAHGPCVTLALGGMLALSHV